MSLLSGFAQGASQGISGGWDDIKEKTAAAARQTFAERMQQRDNDAAMDRENYRASSRVANKKDAGIKGKMETVKMADGTEFSARVIDGRVDLSDPALDRLAIGEDQVEAGIEAMIAKEKDKYYLNRDADVFKADGGDEAAYRKRVGAEIRAANTYRALYFGGNGGGDNGQGSTDNENIVDSKYIKGGAPATPPRNAPDIAKDAGGAGLLNEADNQTQTDLWMGKNQPKQNLLSNSEQEELKAAGINISDATSNPIKDIWDKATAQPPVDTNRSAPEGVNQKASSLYDKQKQDRALKSWRKGDISAYSARFIINNENATPQEKRQAELVLKAVTPNGDPAKK